MIKVKLIKSFLEVKETLNRIGVPSTKYDVPRLYPSCMIVHNDGEYYISHFKELLELEGKDIEYKDEDLLRRDNIVSMLSNWGMIETEEPVTFTKDIKVKILKYQERNDWKIVSKYKVRTSK